MATEKKSCTLDAHFTEAQLMMLRRRMATPATMISRLGGGKHEPKSGCKKYLAKVSDTAAFLERKELVLMIHQRLKILGQIIRG